METTRLHAIHNSTKGRAWTNGIYDFFHPFHQLSFYFVHVVTGMVCNSISSNWGAQRANQPIFRCYSCDKYIPRTSIIAFGTSIHWDGLTWMDSLLHCVGTLNWYLGYSWILVKYIGLEPNKWNWISNLKLVHCLLIGCLPRINLVR